MVKTLTIREDIYKKLLSLKREGESFSDLFERLAKQQESALMIQELRAAVSFEPGEKERMLADIYAKRSEMRR